MSNISEEVFSLVCNHCVVNVPNMNGVDIPIGTLYVVVTTDASQRKVHLSVIQAMRTYTLPIFISQTQSLVCATWL